MTEPCSSLAWDSAHFGFPIARVEGDTLDEERWQEVSRWAEEHSIACLYFLARNDDATTVRTAERAGFTFVDVRVTLESKVASAADGSPDARIRPARASDFAALRPFAASAYSASRFYFDPRFETATVDALYATWLEKSFGDWAEQALVAEVDDLARGYITGHRDAANATGKIGLVGVGMPGRGLGTALVRASVIDFAEHGTETVAVVTQGRNIAAQRLYQRCGFVTRSTAWWYHKWFDR